MAGLRFYFDEDSQDRDVLAGLARAGIDTLTAARAGMRGKTDEEHLSFAASEGRVLYTANVSDFTRLHGEFARSGREHAGVVVRTWQGTPVGLQIRCLTNAHQDLTAEEAWNRLFYLTEFERD